MRMGLAIAGAMLAGFGPVAPARADGAIDDVRTLAKHGAVGVIAGGIDGTYLRVAADLSAVLDDGVKLRVLPMIGKGSVQNLFDLKYLRSVDIAIVQSDVLTFVRQDPSAADASDTIRYVTKLYNEELHILAAKDVRSLDDLRGRKVNTDLAGSGTGMTAGIVLGQLGIPVEESHLGQADAIAALRAGDIAAAVFVAGKPAKLFSSIDAGSGLHFLAVPQSAALLATYLPAQLSHEDYPALVGDQGPVDTIAVGAVMAIYNLPAGTERYRQAAAFIDAFFGKFDKFLEPPRHPKWREVNLAADLPGWKRFQPAADWLTLHGQRADADLRRAFEAYLDGQAKETGSPPSSPEEKAALFARFRQWQTADQTQAAVKPAPPRRRVPLPASPSPTPPPPTNPPPG